MNRSPGRTSASRISAVPRRIGHTSRDIAARDAAVATPHEERPSPVGIDGRPLRRRRDSLPGLFATLSVVFCHVGGHFAGSSPLPAAAFYGYIGVSYAIERAMEHRLRGLVFTGGAPPPRAFTQPHSAVDSAAADRSVR